MNRRTRSWIAMFSATLALTMSMAAQALTATVDTSIYYTGVTLQLNSIPISVRRSDPDRLGANPSQLDEVLPFVMDDTTYLSLRAIATLFDKSVSWDPATHTIYLTTLTPAVPMDSPEIPLANGEVAAGGEEASAEPELMLVPGLGVVGSPFGGQIVAEQAVKIAYRDINVVLDGVTLSLKDANGDPVEPFIMDGYGYLPLRAMANIFGISVDWNADKNVINLTTDQNLSVFDHVTTQPTDPEPDPGSGEPAEEADAPAGEAAEKSPADETAEQGDLSAAAEPDGEAAK